VTSREFITRDRIHPAGTAVALCLIAAASVLFNFFPEKVGIIRSLTDPSSFTPLLAPEFQTHLRLLNLYWGLAFSLGIANLVTLRWNDFTRCIEVALSLLGICILMELSLGGPLTVYGWLDLIVKFGLAVAIIPSIIDAISKVGQLLREQITEPYKQSHAP
jgi:hypothetical protein